MNDFDDDEWSTYVLSPHIESSFFNGSIEVHGTNCQYIYISIYIWIKRVCLYTMECRLMTVPTACSAEVNIYPSRRTLRTNCMGDATTRTHASVRCVYMPKSRTVKTTQELYTIAFDCARLERMRREKGENQNHRERTIKRGTRCTSVWALHSHA